MKASTARKNTTKDCFCSSLDYRFLAFTAYPIGASLYYSFTEYVGIGTPKWIGSENYSALFNDELFWTSLYNTSTTPVWPFL